MGMYVDCPLCGRSDMRIFFEWIGVPVHQNFYIPTRDEAIGCARGDIVLGICENCQFVSNTAFSDSLLQYNVAHDASQHYSPHFQAYLESIVNDLVHHYKLVNKDIVEIGCGQGEFLRLLCQAGNNRGVGFDPSYEDTGLASDERIQFVRELYSDALARQYPADSICCRHTLEHIPRPAEFVDIIQRSCSANRHTLLYFEVPSIEWIFAENAISAVTYGHCSWFCPESLTTLFESRGFDVMLVRETFGREYLAMNALPRGGGIPRAKALVKNRLSDIVNSADKFAAGFSQTTDSLRKQYHEIKRDFSRVALWGAGGKGAVVLNILDVGYEDMEFVIDINPGKHWSYMAGTGQQVVPLASMTDFRPEAIMVTNPLYVDEMRGMLDQLDLHPEIVVLG